MFGSSATPPSLSPSTGATVSCQPSLASLWLCSGASCLPASPSATSGRWCPASRAASSSPSASVASTPCASRPSAIPSLKPWARSSAACVWPYARRSNSGELTRQCSPRGLDKQTNATYSPLCYTRVNVPVVFTFPQYPTLYPQISPCHLVLL